MAYLATVIPVMIASPGDVQEYRSIVRDVLHEWNYVNSVPSNAVMMPVGWETHSSPELGAAPQELINDRILEECDLLIGIFWTRLGTPTSKAKSGTTEEIQRHVAAGKPAMVYFCSAPASLDTVDPSQYSALKEFREWCKGQGLIESFANAADFQTSLRRHLQIVIRKNPYLHGLLRTAQLAGGVGVPAVSSTLPDPREELATSLTEEAKTLLIAASQDKTGTILKISTFGGKSIQVLGRSLGDPTDRRSSAKWEHALEQLVASGLVLRRGVKDQVFELSEIGYQIAEFLESKNES